MTYRLVGCSAIAVYGKGDRITAKIHRCADEFTTYDNTADAMSALIRMNTNHSQDDLVWTIVATATITEEN